MLVHRKRVLQEKGDFGKYRLQLIILLLFVPHLFHIALAAHSASPRELLEPIVAEFYGPNSTVGYGLHGERTSEKVIIFDFNLQERSTPLCSSPPSYWPTSFSFLFSQTTISFTPGKALGFLKWLYRLVVYAASRNDAWQDAAYEHENSRNSRIIHKSLSDFPRFWYKPHELGVI